MSERGRLKTRVLDALADPDPQRRQAVLSAVAAKSLPGPLFSALLSPDPLIRRRAAAAFGPVGLRLAATRLEDARILLRRMMWMLNEESGNLGWGAPEAMAAILAVHPGLAREFHRILVSYVQDLDTDCNFLDHPPLRRDAWRGIALLAAIDPELLLHALADVAGALSDCDPETRGLACLILSRLPARAVREADVSGHIRAALDELRHDAFAFDLFENDRLKPTTVAEQAETALAALF